MGRDKASLPFGPETMLERVARIVATEVDGVLLVARRGQALPAGLNAVFDRDEFQGPLAALITGMEGITADEYFVTVCDQPLLRPALISLLFKRAGDSLAAVPMVGGRLAPTCAVYRRGVLEVALRLFMTGERRLSSLAQHVPTIRVSEDELRAIDPDLHSFLPCNTPEEYEHLLAMARTNW
jgi:molybdopterin-guanine dinucleotide biosynthesis protein A